MEDMFFDTRVYWLVFMIMKQMGMTELYLPDKIWVDSNSPSMTITYDTDSKQYIFRLKEKKDETNG